MPRSPRASLALAPLPAAALLAVLLAPLAAWAGPPSIWVELDRDRRPTVDIPSLAPLVTSAGPACLVVYTEGVVEGGAPAGLPPGHPGVPGGPGGRFQGQGAGFLIHPSGYALTNHHVIENAERIHVRVGTALKEIEATVVGSDPRTDVALLKLESPRTDWPVIPLGDSDELQVGDFVVAIGNPFGLDQTVSMGILSAKGRRNVNPSMRAGLYDFLQTDASINPGNSGGPLLNLHGEAVGINTAINAAAQGIGFAIPMNMVKAMLEDLRSKGRVVRSWIGIGIQQVSPQLAKAFGLPAPAGALVRQVIEDGPGDKAGLKPGDVITRFDGRTIREANELPLLAGDAGVGKTVPLTVMREGRTEELSITLGEHPDNAMERPEPKRPEPKKEAKKPGKASIGLKIVSLNDDDKKRLGLGDDVHGARVVDVEPGSAAAEAGLFPDDIILKADGKDVDDARAFAAIAKGKKSGDVIRLLVRRGGATQFAAIIKP